LPRDIFVSVANTGPGNVTPDAQSIMRPVLDLIQANVPAGSDPTEVFEVIEDGLRSYFAKELPAVP